MHSHTTSRLELLYNYLLKHSTMHSSVCSLNPMMEPKIGIRIRLFFRYPTEFAENLLLATALQNVWLADNVCSYLLFHKKFISDNYL